MGRVIKLDLPARTQAEITLIGSGGYGESVVAHLGNEEWIVVDSCINPITKTSLALEYLIELGVDLSFVKLILCTHWHDDHILGISQILEQCKNAKFSFSKAHDIEKFLYWISFDYQKTSNQRKNSSTIEFNKCIDLIKSRGDSPISSIENKSIYLLKNGSDIISQIFSLSPSDYTMEKFDHEIGALITDFGSPNKKLPNNSPNAKSVALFLKLGYHRAILGADLEVSRDNREGWVNILDNTHVIDKKATLFKIPHHGSENGYHQRIWLDLLEQNPVGKLTPYNKNNGLPDPTMLKKYSQHTDRLYMTAPSISKKPKERDKSIEKIIKSMNYKISEVKYKKGVIRCRIDLSDPNAIWDTALIENSLKISV